MNPLSRNKNSELQRRHRSKVVGFMISEAVALGLLLGTGTIALTVRLTNSTLALSINILTIVAAMAVALIPILFFAIAPVLPGRR